MRHDHIDSVTAWMKDTTQIMECRKSESEPWQRPLLVAINPINHPELQWRIKPKMVRIGRHEWPMPLDVAPTGSVWAWSFEYKEIQELSSDGLKQRAVCQGVAHLTKEAAQQHADALICINRGDV